MRVSRTRLSGQIAPKATPIAAGQFHFVIVGGGASGMLIASRLAQENYSTLVLDAGPDVRTRTTPKWHRLAPFASALHRGSGRYVNHVKGFVGDEEVRLETPRVVGGAGVVLGPKSYVRGHKIDWQSGRFPMAFEDAGIILYYKKLENVEGMDVHRGGRGHFAVTRGRAITQLHKQILDGFTPLGLAGHGFNLAEGFNGGGTGRTEALIDNLTGKTCSSVNQYMQYALDFKRPLTVRAKTSVERLNIENDQVTGVTLSDGQSIDAAKGVFLCAGALGTPQVLRRTAGLPEHLQRALEAKTLWTSPTVTMRYRTTGMQTMAPLSNPIVGLLSHLEWWWNQSGWLSGSYDDMICYLESSASKRRRGGETSLLPYPDIKITVQPFMTDEHGAILPEHGIQFKVQLARPEARGLFDEDGVVRIDKNEEDEEALAEAIATVEDTIVKRLTPITLAGGGALPTFRTYEGPHGGSAAFNTMVDVKKNKLMGLDGAWVGDGSLIKEPLLACSVPLSYALAEQAVDRSIRRAPPVM